MDVRILGPLEVWADGRRIELGGGRQRALLVLLVLNRGQVVSSDRLVDELWAGNPPPTAAKALQNLVSQLRRALGPELEGAIVTHPPGYVLRLDDGELDACRFERLAADARAALERDPRAAGLRLREALALWRGEALAEFAYDEFARAEIARLEEVRLGAVEDRIDADLRIGRHADVLPELDALVAAHPLRERLRAQQMLALYRCGRQADALEAYRDIRDVLGDELGLEPGPSLRELEHAILTQDTALGVPSRLPAPPARRRRLRLVLAAAAAAVVLLVVVGGLLVTREGSPVTVVPESVVSIDADRNDVVGSVPVGELPGQIRVVDDGVFVTSVTDKTLTRIDARTGEVKTSGEHAAGAGLAAAGDQLWVASESRAEVTRVSPRSLAAIETIALDADPGGLVYALPALAFDSLWVSGAAPSAVTRWSLRTNRVVRRYELQPLELPVELASGEGLMWIALLQSNELLRIDVATGGARRVGVGRGPTNPVLAFGSLWVSSTGQGTLWRIDPVTESVERIIDVGEVAFGVAAGGGSIWVGDYCGGAVLRIDPATNRVVARIETGYHPRWLAFAGGRLWVGVSAVEMFDFGCVQANAP